MAPKALFLVNNGRYYLHNINNGFNITIIVIGML